MGRQVSNQNIILFLIALLFTSCGEFVGFAGKKTVETGLDELRLYLNDDELGVLYDSVTLSEYAICRYDGLGIWGTGEIRVRGFTSRMHPKKSFRFRDLDGNNGAFVIALDAGGAPWVSYSLAMYTYSLVGFPPLQMSPFALFMNDEYLGYYNTLPLYDEGVDDFYGETGELFKVRVFDLGKEIPAESFSSKTYPSDKDFSSLNRYLINAAYMSSEDWVSWAEENIDLESVASYMVVRDFLGMADTYNTNFYIYAGDKYKILPWDNDHEYAYDEIGGDNILTTRMFESETFADLYRVCFKKYFLDNGSPDYLINIMGQFADDLYNRLQFCVDVEPVFYLQRSDFEDEKLHIDSFLANRAAQILADPEWDDFFNNGGPVPSSVTE